MAQSIKYICDACGTESYDSVGWRKIRIQCADLNPAEYRSLRLLEVVQDICVQCRERLKDTSPLIQVKLSALLKPETETK